MTSLTKETKTKCWRDSTIDPVYIPSPAKHGFWWHGILIFGPFGQPPRLPKLCFAMFCLTGYSDWVNSEISSALGLRFFSQGCHCRPLKTFSSDCWGNLKKTNFLKRVYKSNAMASLQFTKASNFWVVVFLKFSNLNVL